MSVTLPQEIIDIIITFVADPDDLRQCALVCRAWTPTCHRRLFRHFHILIRDSDPLASTSTGLLQSRLQQYPYIAGCIQKLSIGYDYPCAETSRQEQQLLSIIIPTFFNLVELSLRVCEPERGFLFDVDPILLEALRDVLASPRLKHVTLDGWDFDDLSHFISLMGTSINGAISTLELGRIYFDDHTPATQRQQTGRQQTGPLVTLNSLIVGMDGEAADSWFASLNHPLAVKRLEFSEDWTNSVTHLLARFSSTIEELTINSPDYHVNDIIEVDFSNLSRLSKFTLYLDMNESVLHALLHTLPDSVEALEFLESAWDDTWFIDPIAFLDEFLASPQFARLKTVTFNFKRGLCCLASPLHCFRRYMRRTVGKGIVYLNLSRKVFNSSDIQARDFPSDGPVRPCSACREWIDDDCSDDDEEVDEDDDEEVDEDEDSDESQ